MKCPEQMQLSHADGEALRTRLAGDALTADDRRVLDQVLQWYFWLLFALQEATFSLKRLRVLPSVIKLAKTTGGKIGQGSM